MTHEDEMEYWRHWRVRWLPRVALLVCLFVSLSIIDSGWGYMWRWARDYHYSHSGCTG